MEQWAVDAVLLGKKSHEGSLRLVPGAAADPQQHQHQHQPAELLLVFDAKNTFLGIERAPSRLLTIAADQVLDVHSVDSDVGSMLLQSAVSRKALPDSLLALAKSGRLAVEYQLVRLSASVAARRTGRRSPRGPPAAAASGMTSAESFDFVVAGSDRAAAVVQTLREWQRQPQQAQQQHQQQQRQAAAVEAAAAVAPSAADAAGGLAMMTGGDRQLEQQQAAAAASADTTANGDNSSSSSRSRSGRSREGQPERAAADGEATSSSRPSAGRAADGRPPLLEQLQPASDDEEEEDDDEEEPRRGTLSELGRIEREVMETAAMMAAMAHDSDKGSSSSSSNGSRPVSPAPAAAAVDAEPSQQESSSGQQQQQQQQREQHHGGRLRGESKVLTPPEADLIAARLPTRFQNSSWRLLYSTSRDGISLQTFYAKVSRARLASVLVLRDAVGEVFGCFTVDVWRPVTKPLVYYGSPETFVFTVRPNFEAYKWLPGRNSYFLLSTAQWVACGGPAYALFLDSDLLHGTSAECDTFRSPPLSSSETYECVELEVWGVDQFK